MKDKVLFIINPKSGKGTIKNQLLDIVDIFIKNNMEITIHTTQKELDALELIKERAEDFDLIICSGGDGTLDEVINGMMTHEKRCPVGYLPAGSTNDFANSLKLPKDLKEAARTITRRQEYLCDVGSFNSNYFVYIAAFGIFTDVSYQTKQEMKNVLGHLAYVLEGAKRIFNIKSYHMIVQTATERLEDDFIYGMVTNSESVGGFRNITGKNVDLNDGVFEVTLIRTPQNPIELQEIIGALLIKEIDTKYIYSFKSERIEFESPDKIPWTLDGEYGGHHKIVEVANHKQAISIMADSPSTALPGQ